MELRREKNKINFPLKKKIRFFRNPSDFCHVYTYYEAISILLNKKKCEGDVRIKHQRIRG